nr:MAG TPA: hypothetical protein [Caudoviricetes sp.]
MPIKNKFPIFTDRYVTRQNNTVLSVDDNTVLSVNLSHPSNTNHRTVVDKQKTFRYPAIRAN